MASYIYVALAISLLIECLVTPLTLRLLDTSSDPIIKQGCFYVISFGLTLVLAIATGSINQFYCFVFMVGAMNGLAVFLWMRTIKISYSLTGLLAMPGAHCTGIILGMLLLGEYQFAKSALLLSGIALCILAASIAIKAGWKNGQAIQTLEFVICISIFCLISGSVFYTLRRFSIGEEHIPLFSYLLSWYGGSLSGSILLVILLKLSRRLKAGPISANDSRKIVWIGLLFFCNMLCHKVFAEGIPIIVSQPLYLGLGSVMALYLGIKKFNEAENYKKFLPLVIGSALTGIVLLVVGITSLQ